MLTAVAFVAAAVALVLWWRERRRSVSKAGLDLLLHQLKNPVQSILLHAELLGDAAATPTTEAQAEIRGAIVSEAGRLAAMLSDFSARTAPPRVFVPGSASPTPKEGKRPDGIK